MTNNENTPAASKPRRDKSTVEPTTVTYTEPATPATQPSRGVGFGILIGIAAAALVGGLGIGAVGGFALASATHSSRPAIAVQGGQQGGPQGQGQGGMPGQPPQGGMPGGGQGGPQGQNGGQQQNGPQNGQQQDDSTD